MFRQQFRSIRYHYYLRLLLPRCIAGSYSFQSFVIHIQGRLSSGFHFGFRSGICLVLTMGKIKRGKALDVRHRDARFHVHGIGLNLLLASSDQWHIHLLFIFYGHSFNPVLSYLHIHMIRGNPPHPISTFIIHHYLDLYDLYTVNST